CAVPRAGPAPGAPERASARPPRRGDGGDGARRAVRGGCRGDRGERTTAVLAARGLSRSERLGRRREGRNHVRRAAQYVGRGGPPPPAGNVNSYSIATLRITGSLARVRPKPGPAANLRPRASRP